MPRLIFAIKTPWTQHVLPLKLPMTSGRLMSFHRDDQVIRSITSLNEKGRWPVTFLCSVEIATRDLFRKRNSGINVEGGSRKNGEERKRSNEEWMIRAVCNSIPTAPRPWTSSNHATHLLSAISTGIYGAGVSPRRWSICGTCCPGTGGWEHSHPECVYTSRNEASRVWTIVQVGRRDKCEVSGKEIAFPS